MNFQHVLYKPKKDMSGLAANFQVSERGCFLSVARQIPSKTDNDAFEWKGADGKSKMAIKLDIPDLSGFLALFNRTIPELKLFHKFKKADKEIVTVINSSVYSSGNIPKGFSVNITREGEKYGFGISFAEAETLKLLFRKGIIFLAQYEKTN